MKKEAVRVSTTIPVAPTTLYYAWLNSEQHSAMTGGKAKIDPDVGTKFTAWDGYITGKLITLDLGRRIIMSWRTTEFPRDAADSRVEIHLEALGGNTRVTILHTEIPAGQGEKYRAGWMEHYLDPMRRFFSQYLPDPRLPPPPRQPPPPMDDEEEDEEEPKAKGKGGKPGKAIVPSKGPGKGPGVAKADKTVVAKAPPAKVVKAAKPEPKKQAAAAKKPTPKPAAPAKKPAPKAAAKAPVKKPAPKPVAKKQAAKAPAKKPAKPAKKKR